VVAARPLVLLATVVAATLLPPVGRATGGRYAFAGGTPREQLVVKRALDASSFDWSRVPARITVHIAHVATSYATPGEIWLDARLLDAGALAWGVVQHEFAHQVDFFLLSAPARALLSRQLGAKTWSADDAVGRDALGCERFASALAWSYWQSPENVMRPAGRRFSPARFRGLLSSVLAGGVR
jgi:hypothetical protein